MGGKPSARSCGARSSGGSLLWGLARVNSFLRVRAIRSTRQLIYIELAWNVPINLAGCKNASVKSESGGSDCRRNTRRTHSDRDDSWLGSLVTSLRRFRTAVPGQAGGRSVSAFS